MAHQGGKSLLVCLQYIVRESGRYLQWFPRLGHGTGKTLGILLEPQGSIATHGILPCAKPQEDNLQVILPRLLYHPIHQGEIKLSLRRLDEFPVGRDKHRVEA